MISGKTNIVGLIGWPVGHSVSPAMHNAAFAELGLDWCYVPLPVDPERTGSVGAAIAGLRALGMRGANVTVPHKQAVMAYLDGITPTARAIGAVNTIAVAADGTLTGDNTDAAGFVADLHEHGVELDGRHVLVLGAGGSARSVVYGLATAGASRVAILNRTLHRAEALVAELQPLLPHGQLAAYPLPDGCAVLAAHADLIVNCTTQGMTPHTGTTPWDEAVRFQPGQVVYDLVYNPSSTRLLQQAERNGARAIGGLGMLIWQGALAFEQWTGQPAPVEVMWSAAAVQLARRARSAPSARAFTIRRATGEDASAISRLNQVMQALHAEAHPEFFKAPSAQSFPLEHFAELVAKPDTVIFVAERNGEIVGYLYGDVTPAMETSSTYPFPRFYIHHIAVATNQQGSGCGTGLVEAAKAHAREKGIGTLALSVWHFNQTARRFFARQGFEPYNHRMWIQGLA